MMKKQKSFAEKKRKMIFDAVFVFGTVLASIIGVRKY